jgi:hypothetical protein
MQRSRTRPHLAGCDGRWRGFCRSCGFRSWGLTSCTIRWSRLVRRRRRRLSRARRRQLTLDACRRHRASGAFAGGLPFPRCPPPAARRCCERPPLPAARCAASAASAAGAINNTARRQHSAPTTQRADTTAYGSAAAFFAVHGDTSGRGTARCHAVAWAASTAAAANPAAGRIVAYGVAADAAAVGELAGAGSRCEHTDHGALIGPSIRRPC